MTNAGQLPLELFGKTNTLYHSDKWRDRSCFDVLGSNLTAFISQLLADLGVRENPVLEGEVDPQAIIRGSVYVAKGARVEPTAMITGPCYIGEGAEVRHGAYIRGSVYVGAHAVVGHTTEAKGAVFLDHAKAGHFAYVGDSILGPNCNLGAGTKLANLKLDNRTIRSIHPQTGEFIETNLRKFGAIIGANSQIGCNAVLSPGSLLLPDSMILPCTHYHMRRKDFGHLAK